ncbi:glycosyltransferase [Psychromonas aquimarina]|uniref:glycosyltransferase n=1 Tax=Psychromonas aquimarina TaxID=444919 RepID=UPI0003FD75F6|nr:glycosyltransferase [Psychromonas aquimarina]
MKISVCLTTYNGEKYIYQQLQSILHQLGKEDEVVICDDLSSDNTINIIECLNDDRIKLYVNDYNLGHVRNFEKAIQLSKNDIIVLSDQDDIWFENKLKVIKAKFSSNSSLVLYHHGITTVTEDGNIIDNNYNNVDMSFNTFSLFRKLFNMLVKQHYFGCCMSFKSTLKNTMLPFPKVTYAHDHWISIVATMNSEIECDNQSLIYYRQHSANLTPKKNLGIMKKIQFRLKALIMTFVSFKRKLIYVQK